MICNKAKQCGKLFDGQCEHRKEHKKDDTCIEPCSAIENSKCRETEYPGYDTRNCGREVR